MTTVKHTPIPVYTHSAHIRIGMQSDCSTKNHVLQKTACGRDGEIFSYPLKCGCEVIKSRGLFDLIRLTEEGKML